MTLPTVSVILRSHNDGWCIRETVAALRSQTRKDFQLLAVDNDSDDGSAEFLEKEADQFLHVPKGAYEPGPVLNRSVAESTGQQVVLLNSDATPQDEHWLENLLKPLSQPQVAAVYGRQIARPDAWPMVNFDLLRAYPPQPRNDDTHFFSFVSAAFSREHWEERPFWDAGYAEDYEWTLQLREKGHRLAYAHDSVVMHSHNYTRPQMWKKKYRHGWADAKIHGRATGLLSTLKEATKDSLRDILWGLPKGHLGAVLTSPWERLWQRRAFRRGSVDALLDSNDSPQQDASAPNNERSAETATR